MSKTVENFDFTELGQAIMDAREKQRITREELDEELGISARHLQAVHALLQEQQTESGITIINELHQCTPS